MADQLDSLSRARLMLQARAPILDILLDLQQDLLERLLNEHDQLRDTQLRSRIAEIAGLQRALREIDSRATAAEKAANSAMEQQSAGRKHPKAAR